MITFQPTWENGQVEEMKLFPFSLSKITSMWWISRWEPHRRMALYWCWTTRKTHSSFLNHALAVADQPFIIPANRPRIKQCNPQQRNSELTDLKWTPFRAQTLCVFTKTTPLQFASKTSCSRESVRSCIKMPFSTRRLHTTASSVLEKKQYLPTLLVSWLELSIRVWLRKICLATKRHPLVQTSFLEAIMQLISRAIWLQLSHKVIHIGTLHWAS